MKMELSGCQKSETQEQTTEISPPQVQDEKQENCGEKWLLRGKWSPPKQKQNARAGTPQRSRSQRCPTPR